jgi:uncharacterized protein (TIGR03437 family)
MLLIPALMADSIPWGASVMQTGIELGGLPPALSPNGDIYFNPTTGSSQLVKVNATGQQIFSVAVPALQDADAITWTPDGNVVVTAAFLISKVSGVDGHLLYSTSSVYSAVSVTGDAAGNVYLAGTCSGAAQCVEKRDPSGNLMYQSSLQGPLSGGYFASVAADASGYAYVTGSIATGNSFFLAKLNADGGIQAYVLGNPNETGVSVQLDPGGNPEVLIETSALTQSHVRKYDSTLSTVLFDTPLSGFLPLEMLVDPAGATVLLGGTDSVNLPQLNPTGACTLPSLPESIKAVYPLFSRGVMVRLDYSGSLTQSTFVQGNPGIGNGFAQLDGAAVVIADTTSGQIAVLTLGPAPEVQLGCLGNAASFLAGPLAPVEIISIFGQNLGPTQATSGQPGPGNIYPLQLAGVEVTFDSVAAPLFFVSSGQINAVTPRELTGKTTTHICVTVNGMSTNCMDAPVQPATPGIFLSGGYAAAVNQDGTINSQTNPAAAGSIVSIFATGLGAITPALPDGSVIGLPLPSQDLQISMLTVLGINQQENSYVYGGMNVLYAGPAPYEIEGLSQINFQVPQTGASLFVVVSLPGVVGTTTAGGATIWTTGQTPASCQQLGMFC